MDSDDAAPCRLEQVRHQTGAWGLQDPYVSKRLGWVGSNSMKKGQEGGIKRRRHVGHRAFVSLPQIFPNFPLFYAKGVSLSIFGDGWSSH